MSNWYCRGCCNENIPPCFAFRIDEKPDSCVLAAQEKIPAWRKVEPSNMIALVVMCPEWAASRLIFYEEKEAKKNES